MGSVGKLLLLFTVVPLLELWLLLLIGDVMGFWPTVLLVLTTGALGAWLAKSEGIRVLRRWQAAIAEGRLPEDGVLGGLLVLVGGVLLVTPGVLTDVTGLLLLFPPSRRLIAAAVTRHMERRVADGSVRVVSYRLDGTAAPMRHSGDIIDVEGEVVDTTGRSERLRELSEPGSSQS